MGSPEGSAAVAAVKPSLVRKMVEIMATVDRVPKNGHNSAHDYDYATEADVLDAVRAEMAKRCLLLTPSVVDSKVEYVGANKNRVVTIRVRYTLEDGESGESRTFDMLGEGYDSLDKAFYKAMTGCTKYAVLKTFNLSTGDDPEHEAANSTTPPPPAGVNGLKQRMSKPQPPPPPSPRATNATHDRSLSFGFGNGKGQPIANLDDKSLAWYANCLQRDLADASKSKWHAKTAQQLATLQAEQRMRANDMPEHSYDGPPDDGPPPHGDSDAPF